MRTFLLGVLVALYAAFSLNAQELPVELKPNYQVSDWLTDEVLVPASPLKYQVIFIGGVDMVQTTDTYGNPAGETEAKQWHDFIGFTPDNESSDLGWVSVNHEMVEDNDMIGDGGGMTVFKVRANSNGEIEIVDQTLEDGRQGKFFNVDFVNTVGETGMNCGGITSNADGRIWTAEEWWRGDNESIGNFRDLNDWTIQSDIEGDFNGTTISKYQNLNYMVEIDPRQAKAVRKQYNWGRQAYEGGCVLPDNKTVFLGEDGTPGLFTKFVADVPGDFTKGKTYFFKQSDNGYNGEWVEIDNTKAENMLHVSSNDGGKAYELGATGFNRIEWVTYDENSGKVYFTETGRDQPYSRLANAIELGGNIAYHHYVLAQEQGIDLNNEDEAGDYTDYFGRVMEFDPETNEVRPYINGGPLVTSMNPNDYPNKHLSNPDGLNMMYINGKSYMIINEDLNGTSMGRVPAGIANRTCELWMLDMEKEPTVENLVRVAVTPLGAEVTGACPTPDGNHLFVNSQHPSSDNPYPYNNSLTFVVSGWKDAISSIIENEPDSDSFHVYPNPVSRELILNETTDAALYDLNGTRVKVARNTDRIDVSDLNAGSYYIRTLDGKTTKIIVE